MGREWQVLTESDEDPQEGCIIDNHPAREENGEEEGEKLEQPHCNEEYVAATEVEPVATKEAKEEAAMRRLLE